MIADLRSIFDLFANVDFEVNLTGRGTRSYAVEQAEDNYLQDNRNEGDSFDSKTVITNFVSINQQMKFNCVTPKFYSFDMKNSPHHIEFVTLRRC